MLVVDAVDACYGASQVLFGATLSVAEGEMVTLMGRNGMGKSTLIRTIVGLLPPQKGRIVFRGELINHWPSHRIARLGIGLAPEGRQIFPLLSVEENLLATARASVDRGQPHWDLPSVYGLFPQLRARAGGSAMALSGGEQQMLSIGRALMTNPRLLILDEATEGLAPLVREEICNCVRGLKAFGLAILIVDKNIEQLLMLADRHFILEKGSVAWTGDSNALRKTPHLVERYLGV
jgi:branched-chain amino acid transport system ATP-binding protein